MSTKFTPRKINTFMLLKLPAAFFTGVRVKSLSENKAIVKVKHRWINQNPFGSMFWAVQGMASEFTTGILVMREIDAAGKRIAMYVTNMNATFTKTAKGRIEFICEDGHLIRDAINATIATGEGQTITMTSVGIDEKGDQVSKFEYEWSVKVKPEKV